MWGVDILQIHFHQSFLLHSSQKLFPQSKGRYNWMTVSVHPRQQTGKSNHLGSLGFGLPVCNSFIWSTAWLKCKHFALILQCHLYSETVIHYLIPFSMDFPHQSFSNMCQIYSPICKLLKSLILNQFSPTGINDNKGAPTWETQNWVVLFPQELWEL